MALGILIATGCEEDEQRSERMFLSECYSHIYILATQTSKSMSCLLIPSQVPFSLRRCSMTELVSRRLRRSSGSCFQYSRSWSWRARILRQFGVLYSGPCRMSKELPISSVSAEPPATRHDVLTVFTEQCDM